MTSQCGAADQLSVFYKLVDKRVIASQLSRYARDAELSAQAAVQAEALFKNDSLVVASLRITECLALSSLANGAERGAEQLALLCRNWAVLLSVIQLLLRRLEADTLLPGTIREEALDYGAYAQAAVSKAKNNVGVYNGIQHSCRRRVQEPGIIAAAVVATT